MMPYFKMKFMRAGMFFMLMMMLAGSAAAQTTQAKEDSVFTPARKPSMFMTPKPTAGYLILSPSNNYNRHFGFFCKQEWKLEKQTNIPIRLRLGSLEQTNRLEGKH
jgi:hypothetical protein